jgi:uncharacterized protein (DUF1330 family)
MTLRMCVLLWEQPGRDKDLAEFEDAVLAMLADHGGTVISRDTVIERTDGDPLEVQVLEMPDEQAMTAFVNDPRRAALPPRGSIIARTRLLRTVPVNSPR